MWSCIYLFQTDIYVAQLVTVVIKFKFSTVYKSILNTFKIKNIRILNTSFYKVFTSEYSKKYSEYYSE